jgi:hypothetical protein
VEEIKHLQDVGNQLGLPQDALDNLGTLGKDIILKVKDINSIKNK